MQPARIAELLDPFLTPCHSESAKAGEEPVVLSPSQLHSISTYIDLLLRWNARINLTAVRDPEEIVTRHFGESLFAARHLFPKKAHARIATTERSSASVSANIGPVEYRGRTALQGRVQEHKEERALAPEAAVADIGSGAGFPGIPIKLWAPHISLTLIESSHKKSAFLREVTRALTLTDVNILTTRAETFTGATFDVVTLRAVERFETMLPTSAALLTPEGRLALLIGTSQLDRVRACLPTLSWSEPLPVPLARSRVLTIGYRER
jgi:16S rRNA (guanine527-N7)-methyltransferase